MGTTLCMHKTLITFIALVLLQYLPLRVNVLITTAYLGKKLNAEVFNNQLHIFFFAQLHVSVRSSMQRFLVITTTHHFYSQTACLSKKLDAEVFSNHNYPSFLFTTACLSKKLDAEVFSNHNYTSFLFTLHVSVRT